MTIKNISQSFAWLSGFRTSWDRGSYIRLRFNMTVSLRYALPSALQSSRTVHEDGPAKIGTYTWRALQAGWPNSLSSTLRRSAFVRTRQTWYPPPFFPAFQSSATTLRINLHLVRVFVNRFNPLPFREYYLIVSARFYRLIFAIYFIFHLTFLP